MGRMRFTYNNDSKESSKWADTWYIVNLGIFKYENQISRLKSDCLLSFNFEKFLHQRLTKIAILRRKMWQNPKSKNRIADDLKFNRQISQYLNDLSTKFQFIYSTFYNHSCKWSPCAPCHSLQRIFHKLFNASQNKLQ